jgi:hypothetical protein
MLKKNSPDGSPVPHFQSYDFAAELLRQAAALPRTSRVRMMLIVHAEYWQRVAAKGGI